MSNGVSHRTGRSPVGSSPSPGTPGERMKRLRRLHAIAVSHRMAVSWIIHHDGLVSASRAASAICAAAAVGIIALVIMAYLPLSRTVAEGNGASQLNTTQHREVAAFERLLSILKKAFIFIKQNTKLRARLE